MAIFSLSDFKSSPVGHFTEGTWVVKYHDQTHLSKGTYIRLGEVTIEERTPDGICLFRFQPISGEKLEECFNEEWNSEAWQCTLNSDQKKGQPEKAATTVVGQLRESIVRLGLIPPRFEIEDREYFTDREFAIVILDTNALRNGTVRHFQEQFPKTQIWIIIPTVTLMEIGERAATIKSKVTDNPRPSNSALIRNRPQVTIATQEVEWIKSRFPTETLELAPELLRAFRGYETRATDAYKEPERISINDRLILEGIKDLKRQRNLSEGVYLMSGDKDMSRLARIEGIQTIYPEIPRLQEASDGIYSMRYSLKTKTYVACSIHRFLWDLTHVFSKVRIKKCTPGTESTRQVELFYYYPNKLVNDWVDDKLEVTCCGPSSTTNHV